MDITFYCYLSAPGVESHKQKAYLSAFLSDISEYLRIVANMFLIASEFLDDNLKPQPNYLRPEFVAEGHLLIPFEFQYHCLHQACLRIELLKSTLSNLCYEKGVDYVFEYHLED